MPEVIATRTAAAAAVPTASATGTARAEGIFAAAFPTLVIHALAAITAVTITLIWRISLDSKVWEPNLN